MTPTITRRGIVTIALALTGITLVLLALSMATSAQTIMATPVPVTPTPDVVSEIVAALVQRIIDILREILASLAVG